MIWGWLYHWIYADFWIPVWPNLAASVFIWAFMWWKLRAIQEAHKVHALLTRELHEKLMDNTPANPVVSEE